MDWDKNTVGNFPTSISGNTTDMIADTEIQSRLRSKPHVLAGQQNPLYVLDFHVQASLIVLDHAIVCLLEFFDIGKKLMGLALGTPAELMAQYRCVRGQHTPAPGTGQEHHESRTANFTQTNGLDRYGAAHHDIDQREGIFYIAARTADQHDQFFAPVSSYVVFIQQPLYGGFAGFLAYVTIQSEHTDVLQGFTVIDVVFFAHS